MNLKRGWANTDGPKVGVKVACVFIPSIVEHAVELSVSLTRTTIVSPTFDVVVVLQTQKGHEVFCFDRGTTVPLARHEVHVVWLSAMALAGAYYD